MLDLISSLSSFLSRDLITVGIIRYHNLGGLSQVSVPDLGESMIPTLTEMHSVLLPSLQSLNLWQVGLLPLSYDFVICGLWNLALYHIVLHSSRGLRLSSWFYEAGWTTHEWGCWSWCHPGISCSRFSFGDISWLPTRYARCAPKNCKSIFFLKTLYLTTMPCTTITLSYFAVFTLSYFVDHFFQVLYFCSVTYWRKFYQQHRKCLKFSVQDFFN
jgi:hypothetical protein